MSKVFDAYAAYYDLLYQDKDYAGEVDYLDWMIKSHAPNAKRLLELGCGTGSHAVQFAQKGYSVHGIDLSENMLERARKIKADLPGEIAQRLSFEQGDVRSWRCHESFDVVLSLFHVFSYQITDTDIRSAFRTARMHLHTGGLLILDFWYGPAVEAIGPEPRTKVLQSEELRVSREAQPDWRRKEDRVDVHYHVQIEHIASSQHQSFDETHSMRYFSQPQIDQWLAEAGFVAICYREWMSHSEPSSESWSAVLVAKRCVTCDGALAIVQSD